MRRNPIGLEDFKSVVGKGYFYADKTRLIDSLADSDGQAYVFTRPRRFGKSLALSMLDAYFNLEYKGQAEKWFDGLEITRLRRDDPEMNSYPVIFLNLKNLGNGTEEEFERLICKRIADLARGYKYLYDSDRLDDDDKNRLRSIIMQTGGSELKSSLLTLSELLERHHGRKVVILIDEHDNPVNNAFGRSGQRYILDFCHDFLGDALKSNPHLKFAAVTGVMQIPKESIFSGFNNALVYDVLDSRFDDMFGFTAEDVRAVLEDAEHPEKFEEVREWYEGYRFGDADVYNPWSVLTYVYDGFRTGGNGWVYTGSTRTVIDMIRSVPEARSNLLAMSNGKMITCIVDCAVTFDQMSSDINSLYSAMVMSGYLKAVPDGSGSYILSMPNREISEFFTDILIRMAGTTGNPDA